MFVVYRIINSINPIYGPIYVSNRILSFIVIYIVILLIHAHTNNTYLHWTYKYIATLNIRFVYIIF